MSDASQPPVSLLWPPHITAPAELLSQQWNSRTIADLSLDAVVGYFSSDSRRHADTIKSILLSLCEDEAIIRYRQDVLADLLAQPALVAVLRELQPNLTGINRQANFRDQQASQIQQMVWRLGELELYVESVELLVGALGKAGETIQSEGLRRLRERVTAVSQSAPFQQLQQELPTMLAEIRSARSITVGINLDANLRPSEATLLSINNHEFTGESLLGRLFGRRSDEDTVQGIGALHNAQGKIQGRGKTAQNLQFSNKLRDMMLRPLFRDLYNILDGTSKIVGKTLRRYVQINSHYLAALDGELAFFLGAVSLIQRLQAQGLPFCRPELAPQADRFFEVKDNFELHLALRQSQLNPTANLSQSVVQNDVRFGENGRFFILTGPNQGGKTTYTQAVGLTQILFQAGLFVPGTAAKISPVDGIYTHFPVEEAPHMESGRFGEEAKRLADIFDKATRHSLVLLNESLTSTSDGEGLYVARDVVRALSKLGVRVIFATHLHTLAEQIDALNEEIQGDSKLISMVATVTGLGENGHGVKRTYKVIPAPPMGNSYARDIASRYGISYEKIMAKLTERNIISPLDSH